MVIDIAFNIEKNGSKLNVVDFGQRVECTRLLLQGWQRETCFTNN